MTLIDEELRAGEDIIRKKLSKKIAVPRTAVNSAVGIVGEASENIAQTTREAIEGAKDIVDAVKSDIAGGVDIIREAVGMFTQIIKNIIQTPINLAENAAEDINDQISRVGSDI